eukprot:scaffold13323_cov207-Alexandrium_tamarense.AAC.25
MKTKSTSHKGVLSTALFGLRLPNHPPDDKPHFLGLPFTDCWLGALEGRTGDNGTLNGHDLPKSQLGFFCRWCTPLHTATTVQHLHLLPPPSI